jgi:hypothetical protein
MLAICATSGRMKQHSYEPKRLMVWRTWHLGGVQLAWTNSMVWLRKVVEEVLLVQQKPCVSERKRRWLG